MDCFLNSLLQGLHSVDALDGIPTRNRIITSRLKEAIRRMNGDDDKLCEDYKASDLRDWLGLKTDFRFPHDITYPNHRENDVSEVLTYIIGEVIDENSTVTHN
jgi:hypothetical protein